jgi:peptidoglycan-associated lipoprotein
MKPTLLAVRPASVSASSLNNLFPLILGLVLAITVAGCRHRPENEKNIPDYAKSQNLIDDKSANQLDSNLNTNTAVAEGTPIALTDPEVRKLWPRDRSIFKKDTVYFDYDSTVIKTGEKSKVAAVADYLKAHPGNAVEIEGHCDERGTEEYNRALGERRALALREELARNGVDPMKIDTTSYGKDRPAIPGHDELAHKKNRRGEFLLETPPGPK